MCRLVMRSSVILLSLVLLTGCVTRGGTVTDYCLVAKPIMISGGDMMTDETAAEILRHNETWERLCE